MNWSNEGGREEKNNKILSHDFVRNRWPKALENLLWPSDRSNLSTCNKHLESSMCPMGPDSQAHQQSVKG